MGFLRTGASRGLLAMGLVIPALGIGIGSAPALAEVTTVRGEAYGYRLNVSLFGGPASTTGPAPTVTLPAAGSATPVTASAPTGSAVVGPATFFSSGQLTLSTQGTTGASGAVTTSSTITNVNTSGQESLTASAVTSTCTASETGTAGSTTVTGGTLETDNGLDLNDDGDTTDAGEHPSTSVAVPSAPAAATAFEGHIHVNDVQESFRFVFNEQTANADGSLTVRAGHEQLLGPTAVGDLIIGQVVCGVSAGAVTTTTTTAATTTTTAAVTTTTAAAPTNNTVGGGAFGYYTNVGLFGGAPVTRGPAPTVTLPATGSATPITAAAATGDARYGPGIIFTSGPITVSTQGTPGASGSVTSSVDITTVNTSDQEALTAAKVASSCTASETAGVSATTTITGGRLRVSDGNPDVDGDEKYVDVPVNPAPNTTIEGKVEAVNDTFRYVLNEQVRQGDGSIVVNAGHQLLLGPTGKGDLIVGQSRCATSASAFPGSVLGGGAQSGSASQAASGTTPSGSLAATGNRPDGLVALGVALVMSGLVVIRLGRRRLPGAANQPDGFSARRR